MQIQPSSLLTFQGLDMYKSNGLKFPKVFSLRSTDSQKTFYNVSINENKSLGCYQVYYNDDDNIEPIAEQDMMIYPEAEYIFIDNMFTDEDKRGSGLGTCMHLTNIIEMMENNIQKIELLSASGAIPFHIKCGFKPCDSWKNLLPNIRKISQDDTPELQQYSEDAKELLKTFMSSELKTKLANKLLYNYTKKATQFKDKQEQEYMFNCCINMQLTQQDVLKNKKFYNKLFKKYGIDYQI